MKLIKHIADLNKAIKKEKKLGFVPTMGNLHKGHESLIKISKMKCKKTIVSIFVNPTQFNNKKDYRSYPRSLNKDLKVLKRLKVDYVYLPTVAQIYRGEKKSTIITPPQLLNAYYSEKKEITLTFDQPIVMEEFYQLNEMKYLMKNQFFFSLDKNKPYKKKPYKKKTYKKIFKKKVA